MNIADIAELAIGVVRYEEDVQELTRRLAEAKERLEIVRDKLNAATRHELERRLVDR